MELSKKDEKSLIQQLESCSLDQSQLEDITQLIKDEANKLQDL